MASNNREALTPTINHLFEWAETNPGLLDQWLQQEVNHIIENAPLKHKERLEGLQFRIEMEKRRAKTPLASCLKLSELMYDSFFELKLALENGDSQTTQDLSQKAKVLPFKPKAVNNKPDSL